MAGLVRHDAIARRTKSASRSTTTLVPTACFSWKTSPARTDSTIAAAPR
jgi:hypothetical protein